MTASEIGWLFVGVAFGIWITWAAFKVAAIEEKREESKIRHPSSGRIERGTVVRVLPSIDIELPPRSSHYRV